jgi:ribonucleoside-diphosphate reductase alpha chain
MGAHIKGTNGKSQGVVPFLKVANDTAVAVNQCFAPDTLIFTADGVRPIRDVRPGDLVLGISGTYREVHERYTYNQTDPMVSLDIKHAIEPLTVTAGHPFYAIRGVPMEQSCARTLAWLGKGKVRPEWVDAGELAKGDYVAQVIPSETVAVPGFTADDARMYGILLGDGHLSKDGMQWGVSGNPSRDGHVAFVREYLEARGIHYWETGRGETYGQIHWASGRGVVRDATTGRITGAGPRTLPFEPEDIYDADHNKRISRRFAHLPRPQALALVRGLLETDGVHLPWQGDLFHQHLPRPGGGAALPVAAPGRAHRRSVSGALNRITPGAAPTAVRSISTVCAGPMTCASRRYRRSRHWRLPPHRTSATGSSTTAACSPVCAPCVPPPSAPSCST